MTTHEAHSRYSGSTAARTMNCYGWRQLADTLPEPPSSSFADRGTLLHNAMQVILTADAGFEPESLIGMVYADQTLTKDLYEEKIVPAIAAVEAIFDTYDIKEWVCEERVTVHGDLAWGTADLLGAGDAWGLVLDFKFGDGVMVSPVENHQLKFYGTGAIHTEATADLFEYVNNVVFAIVQPAAQQEETYSVWETTTEAIKRYRDQYVAAIEQAEKINPPLKTGSHCQFCPVHAVCPEHTGAAQRALLYEPDNLETLEAALQLTKPLEKWIADVKQTAYAQLEQGAEIRGWKLVMKRGRRVWNDPAEAEKVLTRKLGGKKQIVEQHLMSPAQIEKLAKQVEVDIGKDMDKLATMISSGTTLAPADDKRAAVPSLGAAQKALASIQ